jgi:thymidylate kinase
VVAGYAARAQADAGRFARIDAHQSLAEVGSAVLASVQQRGWLP